MASPGLEPETFICCVKKPKPVSLKQEDRKKMVKVKVIFT
ncbi:hypothetical protein COLO4_11565 [Corchorus olitorius]|uniref:Uncharacterized protein n=1 Tax=Corchorus olitorius TaxID=93759 RepID=A0A1R3K450_9ROSI|nr:hypothetical protein COLO4_11565 [Corchorus olitorius]